MTTPDQQPPEHDLGDAAAALRRVAQVVARIERAEVKLSQAKAAVKRADRRRAKLRRELSSLLRPPKRGRSPLPLSPPPSQEAEEICRRARDSRRKGGDDGTPAP